MHNHRSHQGKALVSTDLGEVLSDILEHNGPPGPALDMYETPREYILELELPGGIDPGSLSVRYAERNLIIQGQVPRSEPPPNGQYLQIERFSGKFTRIVHLSSLVEAEKTRSEYQGGVLRLSVPKSDEKTISIHIEEN